ncbi:MAG TPA: cytochrome c oxidase subunit II [Tepidisphaeraceae bacterium]|nr:cytochrome c oxidase subunit II [Tepidisphaeraceae bacterium]
MNAILAQNPGGFWMPEKVSTVANSVDGLFAFIFWITVFFFVLILCLLVLFIVKYRSHAGRMRADRAPAHSTALELTWTVIPTVLVLMVFYFGFRGFLHMSVVPPNAYEIQVTGSMWHWAFTYPNGHVDDQLHVPVNVPVQLVLTSSDVIHALYLPQFRIKKDAVPGRYNRMWLQATETGTFDIYCAEYCGQQHSQMRAVIVVQPLDEFRKWLDDASHWETHLSPQEGGKMLVSTNGCLQCHSIDGTTKNGPTFKDLFGRDEPMNDGSSLHVDENYIRESLYDPAAKVVRGFTVQMQSYKGRLRDRDIDAVIAYFKSISKNGPTSSPATQ